MRENGFNWGMRTVPSWVSVLGSWRCAVIRSSVGKNHLEDLWPKPFLRMCAVIRPSVVPPTLEYVINQSNKSLSIPAARDQSQATPPSQVASYPSQRVEGLFRGSR
uniref:Uncharacterized protein n=1 Tax=Picea glauca TaxID=3330 RepID=A0A101LUD9_PICGL|nr:hypothetical protein ABT39_MTgene2637 [Picea glauca]